MSDDKRIEIITDISELYELIDQNDTDRCLVVLDMDDVIIKGKQTVGSDIWFNTSLKNGRNIIKILNDMNKAYSLIDYVTVEDDTKEVLVNILTRKNLDYFIMTSRGIIHYSQTLKHLRNSGVDDLLVRENILKITGADDIVVEGFVPNPDDPVTYPRFRQVRLIDNICFCSGTDKDLVLEEIIYRVHSSNNRNKYKKIIFIDDSLKNVNKVHSSFLKPRRHNLYRGIKTLAIHYAHTEINKRKYDINALKMDDEKMIRINNLTSYLNGKVELNYAVAMYVLLGVSFLWWFTFRFVGLFF